MKALILVDIQNDFVEGGSLAVQDGSQVIPVANNLMKQFNLVVATQDWHPANHGSFASQYPEVNVGDTIDLAGVTQVAWPDHCVQKTHGADFVTTLNRQSIHEVIRKGTDRDVDSYSGFFDNGSYNGHRHATGLGELLNAHGVTDVYVMGLATDYCVKFTAVDAAKLGFTTHLVLDGCRGVELQTGDVERAIQDMKELGISVISSDTLAVKLAAKNQE